MNILYIAYSCLPCKGSEEKIGWNIALESAKTNSVFVLTKEEHRDTIEAYKKDHGIKNINFYYVDIPSVYKKMFKGVAYSMRLNFWHKRAFSVAKEICKNEHIEVVHQITPIEFRSIGDYYKIEGIRFVCGPIGGGEFLPRGLKSYAGKNMAVEHIRSFLNGWSRFKFKLTKKINKCDYLLFANNETKEYLSGLISNVPCSLFFDNGIDDSDVLYVTRDRESKPLSILAAGRIAYRKGHRFLLDVLSKLPEEFEYTCRIVGGGPEFDVVKDYCKKLGLENRVSFTGRISFADMTKEYERADVFIMPSIRETTGAVLLEATSKGLPVITIDSFGGAVLLDNDSGWLYSGNTCEEYIESLKNALEECIMNRKEVVRRGENAREIAKKHIWSKKMKFYQSIYEGLGK